MKTQSAVINFSILLQASLILAKITSEHAYFPNLFFAT